MSARDDSNPNEVGVDDVRRALLAHYDAERSAAPSTPLALLRASARGKPRASRSRLGVVGVLAAAAVIAITVWPRPRADASPAAVLARAAREYLALEDAQLRVTVDSRALELLEGMLDDSEQGATPKPSHFSSGLLVDVARPDRFIVWIEESAASGAESAPIAGCDGERLWTYDPDHRVAHVLEVDASEPDSEFDVTMFLTFDFVRQLETESGRYEIVELETSDVAASAGGGVRKFRLKKKDEAEPIAPWMWNRATVTIDAATENIVSAEVVLRLGPLPLATARLDVIDTNLGLTVEHFAAVKRLPADTRFVTLGLPPSANEPAPERSADVRREAGDLDSLSDADYVFVRTGLRFSELESVLRRNIISTKTAYGMKVSAVEPDSPAERAGVERGDIVMKWAGVPLETTHQLAHTLRERATASEVAVELSRYAATSIFSRRPWKSLEVRLVSRPE